MWRATRDFFCRWPRLFVFGALLFATAVGFGVAAGIIRVVDPGDRGSIRVLIGFCMIFAWVAGLALGVVLSNVGYDPKERSRSFPFCLPVWLFAPPAPGEVPSIDRMEPRDVRHGVFYLLAIVPVAFVKLLQLARSRVPEAGDLVSFIGGPPDGGFIVATVESFGGRAATLRVIERTSRRPRAIRLDTNVAEASLVKLELHHYKALKPKLYWRGDLAFWSVDKRFDPVIGRYRARPVGNYGAIVRAGRNVDRLRVDPHAFDRPAPRS